MTEKKIFMNDGVIEKDEDDDDACCCCMPTETIGDKVMLMALIFLLIGLTIATIGYAIPRDYNFDNRLPAREMEARERYYANLGHNLDMCIIMGMSFVAVGGLLTMSVFTYTVLFFNCGSSKEDSIKLVDIERRGDKDYGSVTSS